MQKATFSPKNIKIIIINIDLDITIEFIYIKDRGSKETKINNNKTKVIKFQNKRHKLPLILSYQIIN